MSLNIVVDVPEDAKHYLESSARLRGISRTMLMRRVLETVLLEKLVLSVLDDGDAAPTPVKPGRPATNDKPPRDKLFDAVVKRAPSVPQSKPVRTVAPYRNYKPPQTRADLQRELQQAVLNTGGSLVE